MAGKRGGHRHFKQLTGGIRGLFGRLSVAIIVLLMCLISYFSTFKSNNPVVTSKVTVDELWGTAASQGWRPSSAPRTDWPPPPSETNGYLRVRCNGGLNQQRSAAFAEWVLFTSSGIASGLYHACDVGTWCILSFKVLQFMDFWLSFMAVVSTFIFLTTVDEGMKRTMHTVVAILTGLMAANGPTKSSNIVYVIAIGIVGLVIGLIMESSTYSYIRSISCTTRLRLNIIERWATVRHWFYNLLKTLRNLLRWIFVIPGFVFFALAAISWTAETSESYWIWHSTWHVSIYTSSFFFLCSKVRTVNTDNGEVQAAPTYELARQDSFSRGEMN